MLSYLFLAFVLLAGVNGEWPDYDFEDVFEITFDPDILHNVSQLISSKGYPVEDHVVQTEDGFLLSVQHIPHGKKGCDRHQGSKEVVFLQHGLLSASSDWVINFPNESLGFLLADAGYDVWLGNIRGNTYSRRHIKYSPHSDEFWDYSFAEMGYYDLPAMIDYILNQTGQKQLSYIGHSQGTTSCFAMLSEKTEYNQKIKVFIALAPVTTVGYITSPIRYLAPFTNEFAFLARIIGVREFLPSNALMKFLSEYVCDTFERWICKDVMFLLFGRDFQELNVTRIGVYSAHTPAGSSTKSVLHYAQLVDSGKFGKYDYGKRGNIKRYGQDTPPQYDLTKITAPVALMWSLNDELGDPVDVGLLIPKLKSLIEVYEVPAPLFNHGDFVLALHAKTLLYDEVMKVLRKYAV
ncbi:gastric triacylglycerol lipase-like [Argiope bruennichi]|uniref:gastric triacylglycerol lipase-like n=1 Tax=Argiope bruennichi TaxID=94029 RepID=UPI002495789B|nr:gastric triacylglycerol lipase-like [Argiope bruennichi]